MAIFVFRQETDDIRRRELLFKKLQAGQLRQGWGWHEDFDLRHGEKGFIEAILTTDYPKDRAHAELIYRKVARMLEIKAGDRMVIPKQPDAELFTVATATGSYNFEADAVDGDFRHSIPVDTASIKVLDYTHANWGAGLRSRLRGIPFSGPVVPVRKPELVELFSEALRASENIDPDAGDLISGGRTEGGKRVVYGTRYERDPRIRAEALRIHGLKCGACEFEFEKFHGAHGTGYIHVHHIKPLHQGIQAVSPATDVAVLCANCHAMIHRKKTETLSVEELRRMIEKQRSS